MRAVVEWIAKRLKARATTTRTLADSHSINNRGGATRDQKRKGGRFWRGDGLRHRPKLTSPTLSRPEKGQARSKNARAGASCFAPFVGAKSEDLFAPAPLRFVLVPGLLLWLLATPTTAPRGSKSRVLYFRLFERRREGGFRALARVCEFKEERLGCSSGRRPSRS